MNILQMAAMARDHWKVTNPEIYRQMVEDKALEACSEAAAKLTMSEMKTLMLVGLTEQEAWQESRHLFIFRTAEALEKAYQPERDENGKVIRPDWQRDSEPLPKKTSTPRKSILEKLSSSAENAMLTTYKPPKQTSTPPKLTGAQIAHLLAKEMTSGKNVPGYKPPKVKKGCK